tara:strand:+ start:135 stop:317 length:183 start_codon:yes stop_codon:yes gene_type:complete
MTTKEIQKWYRLVIRARKSTEETAEQILKALKTAKFYDPRGAGNKAWNRYNKIRKAYEQV